MGKGEGGEVVVLAAEAARMEAVFPALASPPPLTSASTLATRSGFFSLRRCKSSRRLLCWGERKRGALARCGSPSRLALTPFRAPIAPPTRTNGRSTSIRSERAGGAGAQKKASPTPPSFVGLTSSRRA